MEYIQGMKLLYQPYNLRYGFRFNKIAASYFLNNKFENGYLARAYKREIEAWCDKNFGMTTIVNGHGRYNWNYMSGSKYYYYFFKSKEDASLFKITWA